MSRQISHFLMMHITKTYTKNMIIIISRHLTENFLHIPEKYEKQEINLRRRSMQVLMCDAYVALKVVLHNFQSVPGEEVRGES